MSALIELKPIYILGSSGYARELKCYFVSLNPDAEIFLVDDYNVSGDTITLDEYNWRFEQGLPMQSIMGSGNIHIRKKMIEQIHPPFATFIHPLAIVYGAIGAGSVIAPGTVVAPNATIEPHVLVNYNSTIGHDAYVSSISVISPNASISGWCVLEQGVYVGAGAVIKEHCQIGSFATIGMGSVVTKSVPSKVTVTGIPGRW